MKRCAHKDCSRPGKYTEQGKAWCGYHRPSKPKRGFALLPKEKRSEFGRKGAKKAHAIGRAHRWTQREAAKAARTGWKRRKR